MDNNLHNRIIELLVSLVFFILGLFAKRNLKLLGLPLMAVGFIIGGTLLYKGIGVENRAYATAPTISSISVDAVTSSSMRVNWTPGVGATSARILYGTTTSYGSTNTVANLYSADPEQYFISGLSTSTLYYICPQLSNAGGEWSDCVGGTNRVSTTTLTTSSPTPTLPTTYNVPSLPTIDGNTYTVSSDCSDLQAKINSAASADPSKNHQVLIPYGADCAVISTSTSVGNANLPALTLPSRATGTGEVIIRSSASDSSLPRSGNRPTSADNMPILRNNEIGVRELSSPPSSPCDIGQLWWHYNQPGWSMKECTVASSSTYSLVSKTDFSGTAPTTCSNTDSWYYKTDASSNVQGIYWCASTGKLYQIQLGRGEWILASPGAHHYRFFGISFQPVPMKDFSSNYYTDGSYFPMFFNLATSTNITFDRNYIDGLGTPNRIQNFINGSASYLGFIDNVATRITFALPNTDWYGCNGCTAIIFNLSGGQFLTIKNNTLEATGITVFASDDLTTMPSDVVVQGNYFPRPDKYFYGKAENIADGYKFYISRHHVELKRGVRWLINGNIFNKNFSVLNKGEIIALSPRPGTDKSLQIADITITNNILKDAGFGMNINGHNDNTLGQYKTLQRVNIENNLIYGLDSTRTVAGANGTAYGICFMFVYGVEDVTVKHNTCGHSSGFYPAFIWEQYGPSAGLRFSDNLVWNEQANGYGGAVSPGTSQGTASLNAGFPGGYNFSTNILIDTTGNASSTYPSNNTWVYPQSGIAFTATSTGNYKITTPAYQNTASDGTDRGVNMGTLNSATQYSEFGQTAGTDSPMRIIGTFIRFFGGYTVIK